jgi:hypothetical protein
MLTLKIGRKKMVKFFPGIIKNIEGYINFQNHMWTMVNDSIKKYHKKNTIEKRFKPFDSNVFDVNVYHDIQKLDNEYNMEWLVCDIVGINHEAELKEFEELDRFEETLKENFEKNKKDFVINKPTPLKSAILNKVIKTKESILDIIEKGTNQDKNKTISSFLLDLDIIIVKIPPTKQ